MAVMIDDEPKCSTPGVCYNRHVAGCPRYVPLINPRITKELELKGWSLEVGEHTDADKRDRRSAPMTLYVQDARGPFQIIDEAMTPTADQWRRWSDPQDVTPVSAGLDITKPQDHGPVALSLMVATGRALDALSRYPRLAGEPDADFRERIQRQRKPHLRLHVKLGKHTGAPYWAVLPRECDISMVGQWQVTDAKAMARAKQLMGLGLPVR